MGHPKIISAALVALALSVSPLSQAKAETPAPTTAWQGLTLFDATHPQPRAQMTLVVQGERLIAVQFDQDPLPEGTRIIPAHGQYALPGLIDAHIHLATPPNAPKALKQMKRWVYSGVTAVRGMADDLRSVSELARQARVGEVPSPDLYYAALFAGPSFFDDPRTHAVSAGTLPGHSPWMQAITPQTDLPLAVAMARGTGASGLKIYTDLEPDLVRAITLEAHRQGLPVWTHAMVYPSSPLETLTANPDVLSHACILAHQAQDPDDRPRTYASRGPIRRQDFLKADHPVIAGLVQQIADRPVILDATVRVYVEQDRRHAAGQSREPVCSGPMTAALTRQAWRAGVPIAAGTDGETAETDPWPALIEELELLQNLVGMPASQVLISATQINARALNQEAEMGSLDVGKLANFIILSQDPTKDVANLRSLTTTVKRGHIYPRAEFTLP